MSSYVEMLLPIFIYPLGLALLLCIIAFVLSFAGHLRALRASIAAAVFLLWLASTPAFADLLTAILEEQNPLVSIETIAPKDVVVVLGGGVAQQVPMGLAQQANIEHIGDRFTQVMRLWRAGKAQTIIVSSGNLP